YGPPIDPTVAAYSILGVINWVARWYQTAGSLDHEQIAAQITLMVLQGLAPQLPAAVETS
ncbi:MAG: TetR/AcrR family transcriptional regulator, partial [Planctomycetota bacterium]